MFLIDSVLYTLLKESVFQFHYVLASTLKALTSGGFCLKSFIFATLFNFLKVGHFKRVYYSLWRHSVCAFNMWRIKDSVLGEVAVEVEHIAYYWTSYLWMPEESFRRQIHRTQLFTLFCLETRIWTESSTCPHYDILFFSIGTLSRWHDSCNAGGKYKDINFDQYVPSLTGFSFS